MQNKQTIARVYKSALSSQNAVIGLKKENMKTMSKVSLHMKSLNVQASWTKNNTITTASIN